MFPYDLEIQAGSLSCPFTRHPLNFTPEFYSSSSSTLANTTHPSCRFVLLPAIGSPIYVDSIGLVSCRVTRLPFTPPTSQRCNVERSKRPLFCILADRVSIPETSPLPERNIHWRNCHRPFTSQSRIPPATYSINYIKHVNETNSFHQGSALRTISEL